MKKLQTKDLISAGAFGAIYLVVVLICVVILSAVPVLYLLAPFLVGVMGATVYLLNVVKIHKFGAISILGVLFILLACTGSPYAILCAAVTTILAELIAKSGKYASMKKFRLSYVMFNLNMVAPFLMLLFAKAQFLSISEQYYGAAYVEKISALTPSWMIAVLIVEAVVGALIGVRLAEKLFKKHFDKAGVL